MTDEGGASGDGCAHVRSAGDDRLAANLSRIRHKILVLSGKGGVGKSTVAVNLAVSLAMEGHATGLLDADIHGPSVPIMLGIEGARAEVGDGRILPVDAAGLRVVSIGLFDTGADEAFIWRGPLKAGVIRQFLSDVEWGDLDFLVVDSPPGTGDEPLSVCQLMGTVDGAVIVTTPQRVCSADVRRSITFCRRLGVPVLGVIENMSGFACPSCGEVTRILRTGGGRETAERMGVPFLGSIPLDPAVAESGDSGRPFIHHYRGSATAGAMSDILEGIAPACGERAPEEEGSGRMAARTRRIAVPLHGGVLCAHFGHCEKFAVMDVDCADGRIASRSDMTPPPHEPGLLPRWLAGQGVQIVVAGGMGSRARQIFEENGISVITGAPAMDPEAVARGWAAGSLELGENACDH